jgi:hypothetical protein
MNCFPYAFLTSLLVQNQKNLVLLNHHCAALLAERVQGALVSDVVEIRQRNFFLNLVLSLCADKGDRRYNCLPVPGVHPELQQVPDGHFLKSLRLQHSKGQKKQTTTILPIS